MTSPISAISGLTGLSAVKGLDPAAGSAAASGPNTDFGGMLTRGLQSVQNQQSTADTLAMQAANGTLQDPAQYTMAATQAQLGLDLTLAIRNKAVDAFQEIMRMQA